MPAATRAHRRTAAAAAMLSWICLACALSPVNGHQPTSTTPQMPQQQPQQQQQQQQQGVGSTPAVFEAATAAAATGDVAFASALFAELAAAGLAEAVAQAASASTPAESYWGGVALPEPGTGGSSTGSLSGSSSDVTDGESSSGVLAALGELLRAENALAEEALAAMWAGYSPAAAVAAAPEAAMAALAVAPEAAVPGPRPAGSRHAATMEAAAGLVLPAAAGAGLNGGGAAANAVSR